MLRGIERARRLQDKRRNAEPEGEKPSLARKVNEDLDRLDAMIFDTGKSPSNLEKSRSDPRNPRAIAREANARLDKIARASAGYDSTEAPPRESLFDEAYLRQDPLKGGSPQSQQVPSPATTTSRLGNLSPTMDRAGIVAKVHE